MMASKIIKSSSVLTSRFFYSVNWFNISPALIPLEDQFHITLGQAGIALTMFLVGAGIFQVPAGILATKLGSKRVAILGLYIMAAFAVFSGFSSSFSEIVVGRFMTGVGAAFYFSTAIVVLREIYPEKIHSLIGYYNASYNLGAGAGIIFMTPVVEVFGWRMDFIISGLLTAASAIFMQVAVHQRIRYGMISLGKVRTRVLNRRIWLIALALLGVWSMNYTLPEYFKSFGATVGIPSFTAGVLGGIIPIAGVAGGVVSGLFFRYRQVPTLASIAILLGLAVSLLAISPAIFYWPILIVTGLFATVAISLEYSVVAKYENEPEYIAISIGLINSVQIGLGSLVPLIFGYLARFGFSYSWVFLGIFCAVTIVFFLPLGQVENVSQSAV
ncbi:MAG: MFS transporter [Thermoplasmataceae archaeon]